VAGVLRILQEEVANAMALTGCRTVSDIGPDLVTQVPG
jgi:isopentenyl diphosphate isomerase/L-lactate dehydrogenase-like FMN-dependent dehydrogenase